MFPGLIIYQKYYCHQVSVLHHAGTAYNAPQVSQLDSRFWDLGSLHCRKGKRQEGWTRGGGKGKLWLP